MQVEQCTVFLGTEAGALAGRFDGTRLRYNKDSLENPPFLAMGDPTGAWWERIAEDSKA